MLGRKPGMIASTIYLLNKGIDVTCLITREDEWKNYKEKERIRQSGTKIIFSDKELYELIKNNDPVVQNIDLVISYVFWKKIKTPLVTLGSRGCINFHPAPLPEYKNRAGYNTAILEGKKEFGVSVHYINSEEFDSGPIIDVRSFQINPETINVHALEKESHTEMIELFKQTIDKFITEKIIITVPNEGGLSVTSKDLEMMKNINLHNDSNEEIHKKIRAFFFPPYHGALIEINGEKFTLLDKNMLEYLDNILKNKKN